MHKESELIGAFVDGELEGAELDAFRDHLIECEECQAELAELMQLRAAEEVHGKLPLRAAPAPTVASVPGVAPLAGGEVVSLSWWRKKRVQIVIATASLAAAAAVLLMVLRPSQPVLLAENTSRSFEPRLAYEPIDRYRPYEVTRAEGPRGEAVSFEAMARLQRQRDTLGLVAGHLLLGERAQAEALLSAAPRTPELDVARAAAALAAGHPDEALALTDGVLDAHPRMAQALWNRALAERDLHLELAAAADFESVAELGERGWRDEAQARAAELRHAYEQRKTTWANARPAGEAMVRTGQLPSPELVRAAPDYLRLYLFFATVAADRARLATLRPLAVELDARDGGHVLTARIDHYIGSDAGKRAPLIAPFRKLFEPGGALPPAQLEPYLHELERAGEGELEMAVLLRANQVHARLATFARLAKASGDLYLVTRADEDAAMQAVEAADLAGAERVLTASLAICEQHHFDYRAVALRWLLADVYRRLHRTAEAEAAALRTFAEARHAAFNYEARTLFVLADVARLRNDFAPMNAYLREAGLRDPKDCESQRYIHESRAAVAVVQLDMPRAARELAEAPSCASSPPSLQHIDLEASLVRAGQPVPATMAQDLIDAKKGVSSVGERAFADVVAARATIDRDPQAGAALIARALEATAHRPDADTDSLKARSYATLTLAVDAARRGAWDDALGRLADGARAPLPSGCVLGVAVDHTRAFAVARVPGKPALGSYGTSLRTADPTPEELVPPSLRAALAGCDEVAVLAPPPVNGLPRILPPEIAWAYVIGAHPPAPAAVTAPRRLVVSDVEPPPSLALPRLAAWTTPASASDVVWLRGPEATPARVLDELAHATEAEIHAHGIVDLARSDASMIVLSPDAAGDWALTAGEIRARPLAGHPVVILAACHAAKVAMFYHQPWSLPFALVAAGARAVLASPDAIPDAQAGPFFEDVLRRVRAGKSPAQALRDARLAVAADERMRWTANILVFE